MGINFSKIDFSRKTHNQDCRAAYLTGWAAFFRGRKEGNGSRWGLGNVDQAVKPVVSGSEAGAAKRS